jgi:hypothetical protein
VINHVWMTRLDDDWYDGLESAVGLVPFEPSQAGVVPFGLTPVDPVLVGPVPVEQDPQVAGFGCPEPGEDDMGPFQAVAAAPGLAETRERPA